MTDTEHIVSRGRPRCFDAEAGVVTAARLFHERGYDSVGVAELTRAIGISPPSFYAAYGSKAGLLERVLEHYASHEAGFVSEALAGPGPLADAAHRLFVAAARAYSACDVARGCLVLEGMRNCIDPEVAAQERAAHSAFLDGLRSWLGRAGLASDTATVLADYMLTILSGLSSQARTGATTEALERSAEIASDGFRLALERRGLV